MALDTQAFKSPHKTTDGGPGVLDSISNVFSDAVQDFRKAANKLVLNAETEPLTQSVKEVLKPLQLFGDLTPQEQKSMQAV